MHKQGVGRGSRGFKSRAPNIRDVARELGVSTATVSKALNGKSDVATQTRERVLAVCEQLGYRINSSIQDLARLGRGGPSRHIAFVMVGKAFADPAYARAIDGVSRAAANHGLYLILDQLRGDETRFVDLPPVLRDGRVDGVLITGDITERAMDMLVTLELPLVVIGSYARRITAHAINVRLDVNQRIADLVQGLVQQGCRRLAYFTEIPDGHYELESIDAFKSALRENGLPVDEHLIYLGKGPFTGATEIMEPVFTQTHLPFDGIVCLDFRTAVEISHLIGARAGIGAPPDVVMALCRPFDYYRLPIPAIYGEASLDEVAYEGVNALMEVIAKKNERPRQILLHSKIEIPDIKSLVQ